MFKVALIGAGRIGQIHASSVVAHPGCQLTYVSDVYSPAATQLAEKYNATVVSVEEALTDNSIDIVLICTVTDTHADLIEASAKAGKAIFCEKPVDLSLERVRQCLKVVEDNKVPLMVGFNRRFDPNFAQLESALEQDDIGNLELLTISSRDPGAPGADYIKGSGGLFRDMTIHDLDMARFLLKEEPVSVYASASSLVSKEVKDAGDVDTAIVTLTCASGKIAVITNSRRASYGYDQRVEVHGSEGMLQVVNVPESTLVQSNAQGVTSQKPLHFFLERYAASYRNEFTHFVKALKEGSTPNPTGLDGERALLLADAALESLKTGKAVSITDFEVSP
jgi:myo-inositol 2-dehydrogenase/D-chiro-inositol 1-dehydrogenase